MESENYHIEQDASIEELITLVLSDISSKGFSTIQPFPIGEVEERMLHFADCSSSLQFPVAMPPFRTSWLYLVPSSHCESTHFPLSLQIFLTFFAALIIIISTFVPERARIV